MKEPRTWKSRALVGGIALAIFAAGMYAGAAGSYHLFTQTRAAPGDEEAFRWVMLVGTVVDDEGNVRPDDEIRERVIQIAHMSALSTVTLDGHMTFSESRPRAIRAAGLMTRGDLYERSPDNSLTRRSALATACMLEHADGAAGSATDCVGSDHANSLPHLRFYPE